MQGCSVALGGARASFSDKSLRGHFFQATVLTNVTQEMDIMKEEIFGPVLPVYKFTTEEEVLFRATLVYLGVTIC